MEKQRLLDFRRDRDCMPSSSAFMQRRNSTIAVCGGAEERERGIEKRSG